MRRVFLAPFPGASCRRRPPGYVESRSPGLPRVPRERRVPRAARLQSRTSRASRWRPRVRASGLRWADYRVGGRRPDVRGSPCVRSSWLPPVRGRADPGTRLSPPSVHPRDRAVLPLSPGLVPQAFSPSVSPLRLENPSICSGRIPRPRIAQRAFRRCPACPAGRSRSNSTVVSLRRFRSSVVYGALARGHRCLRSLPLRRDVSPHRVRRLHRSRRAPRTRPVRRVARKRRARRDEDRAVFRVPRSLWVAGIPVLVYYSLILAKLAERPWWSSGSRGVHRGESVQTHWRRPRDGCRGVAVLVCRGDGPARVAAFPVGQCPGRPQLQGARTVPPAVQADRRRGGPQARATPATGPRGLRAGAPDRVVPVQVSPDEAGGPFSRRCVVADSVT